MYVCARVRVYAARARARSCAFLRGCVPRLFACLPLRVCMPASDYALVFTNRSTVPFTRPDFPSCSIFDSCTPFSPPFHNFSLPPPALVVTLSLPLPSTHLSLSPPVPAFSNPITLISYPVIRRLIDYSSTERKVCKRKYNSLRITRFH